MVNLHESQQKLMNQAAEELPDKLQKELEKLRSECRRQAIELQTAKSAIQRQRNGKNVQELIEHNTALQEQVAMLKNLIQTLQQSPQSPSDRVRSKSMGNSSYLDSDFVCEQPQTLVPITPISSPKEESTRQDDLQNLIAKLTTKEMQLDVANQQSASWEQEVIRLKFELECVKHSAQEQQDKYTAAKQGLVRQSSCSSCGMARSARNVLLEKLPGSPRTIINGADHYKTLAATRARHWSEALAKCDKVKRKLALERQLTAELSSKLQTLESQLASLKIAVSESNNSIVNSQRTEQVLHDAEAELRIARDDARRARQQLQEEVAQIKIERRRTSRVIQDLRTELNKQLMEIERVQKAQAAIPTRRRSSRGIPSMPSLPKAHSFAELRRKSSRSLPSLPSIPKGLPGINLYGRRSEPNPPVA